MTQPHHLFLVVADRSNGTGSVADFGTDREAAMAALKAAERRDVNADVEVVLLTADSLETLKRTHSSYFGASFGSALSGISN